MISTPQRIVAERSFTQQDFDLFARLSGDDNPVHVDPRFCATARFGRTVAHGVLLVTAVRGLIGLLVPGGRQLSQNIMFPAPTYADEPMRIEATITQRSADRITVAFAITRTADDTVTCKGETVLRAGGAA